MMDFHVYLHHRHDDEKLTEILRLLRIIIKEERAMAANLDDLTAKVQATTDAEDSAIVLLNGLAQMLKDSQNDPAAIAALSSRLSAGADKLGAAIVANTPADQATSPNRPAPPLLP